MSDGGQVRVAIVGCGLIGKRRAEHAARHPGSRVVVVADSDPAAAARLGEACGVPHATQWSQVIAAPDVDAVVVATPNGFLAEIAIAALKAHKHVLVEKPMGRNASEALQMAGAATAARRVLKVGFNHRYHPGLARARALVEEGAIGKVINLRARYGHGGRPGYEKEWRGDRELAGGGELTDQGVHVLDLIHWFAGEPSEVFAYLQTAVWPIRPLEDSAFALLRFPGGAVASLHTAWTQWKNLFSFEVFGDRGMVAVEGLGRSYGPETLTFARRRPEGGAPYVERTVYDEEDVSWAREWEDFLGGIAGAPYLGTPNDGLTAMRLLESLYRSAETHGPVEL
jgi:predicted dehydrogenase